MPDPISAGIGLIAGQLIKLVYSFKKGDISVSNTRIVRLDRGMPWDLQAGVHPLPDGTLKITPLKHPTLPGMQSELDNNAPTRSGSQG
jgi:hypothetical protein